jgi:flagellar protein FlbD
MPVKYRRQYIAERKEFAAMIKVTRINKIEKFWVNEDKIEFIEETPDTIISMESGKKFSVAEPAEEVVSLVVARKREIFDRYR